jgi:hypothetical protein
MTCPRRQPEPEKILVRRIRRLLIQWRREADSCDPGKHPLVTSDVDVRNARAAAMRECREQLRKELGEYFMEAAGVEP